MDPLTIAEGLEELYPSRRKSTVYRDPSCGGFWVAMAYKLVEHSVCPYCPGPARPVPGLVSFDFPQDALAFCESQRKESLRAALQIDNLVANLAQDRAEKNKAFERGNQPIEKPVTDGSFFDRWLKWQNFPIPESMGFNKSANLLKPFPLEGGAATLDAIMKKK